MTIWSIENWCDNDPHWSAAFIEAESAYAAQQIMIERLQSDIDTIWKDHLLPPEQWTITEVNHPFVFILGQGCR